MSAVSTSTARDLYSARYPLIVSRIDRHLSAGPDREERFQQALCWSWAVFVDYLGRGVSADHAALIAAKIGALRSGRAWVATRDLRQVDALDSAERLSGDEAAPDRRDAASLSAAELSRIFPSDVRPVVQLLAEGHSRVQVAAMLGVSPATITRRCERIEQLLS